MTLLESVINFNFCSSAHMEPVDGNRHLYAHDMVRFDGTVKQVWDT